MGGGTTSPLTRPPRPHPRLSPPSTFQRTQYLGAALLLRALLASAAAPRPRLPPAAELSALRDTFLPLSAFYLAKNCCYMLLQRAATALPAVLLAAHQPCWSLWNLVAFTNTPLEQAALVFLPSAASALERRETVRLLMLLGLASGAVGAAAAVGPPLLAPWLLTQDPALWPHMASVAAQGAAALLLCGADVSATGVLLALRDRGYVARSMAVSLAGLGAFLWSQRAAGPSLGLVWWGLVVFFGLRAAQSVPRAVGRHLWQAQPA